MLLNITFALFVIFAQRRNPAATWAWLMVIALFPIGGFIIYMVLGQDSRKNHVFKLKAKEDEKYIRQYSLEYADIASENCDAISYRYEKGSLAYLHHHSNHSGITENNSITLFHNGRDKFDAFFNDIKKAKDFIFLQVYILRGDETGQYLIHQLAQRASSGVTVRLLIDGMGCIFTSKRIFKPLIDAGGEVGVFMPPVPVRMNFRNHRKLAVIDGKTGYIGGLNIGDEYLGKTKRFGPWRDTHVCMEGKSVEQLTLRFLMDWNFAKAKKMPIEHINFFNKPFEQPLSNGIRIQIVSSGPDTRYAGILYGFCKMITEAKQRIFIQTPYFVPDESLFGVLRVAALSGVDVRIMFPANPDHPFVYWAGLSYLGDLMDVGVKAYEYTKGFIHSKTIMADGAVCSIGSANVDVRSFRLNFETTAFIYDKRTVKELEEVFLHDMNECRLITPDSYAKRGRIVKIKESVSRLFAPLL